MEVVFISRKIAFASGKGGVGKSTIISNLSVATSQLGENVILVDADIAMADVGLELGIDVDGPTLQDILAGDKDISEATYSGPAGVSVIPAAVSFHEVTRANPEKLDGLTDSLAEEYDYVFIDSPSGFGKAAISSLKASDEIVLIVNPTMTSISDALRTKEIAARFNKKILGVVVSKSSDSSEEIPIEKIKSTLELPILDIIPEDPNIKKSAYVGSPAVVRYPDSPSAGTIRNLAKKILSEDEEINYQDLAEKNISEIKKIAQEKNINYSLLLEIEKEGKNREDLKKWLKSEIESTKSEMEEAETDKDFDSEKEVPETGKEREEALRRISKDIDLEESIGEKTTAEEETSGPSQTEKIIVLILLALGIIAALIFLLI